MKACDYIVDFLQKKGIRHAFGYPGGMVTYLMDSFYKHEGITAHLCYHEQAAAMAACGFAQVSGLPGVAFATSGPGATNLITGIANAYFDSIPALFITGQVNTAECMGPLKIRQKGFQETDIIAMVRSVTKYCVRVGDARMLRYHLECCWQEAVTGRPGPVLLDIPIDLQRAELDFDRCESYAPPIPLPVEAHSMAREIVHELQHSKRPCVVVGAGVSMSGMGAAFVEFVRKARIPVLSSMLAVDLLSGSPLYYGFIGAYGHRYANFIAAKSDCILSLGSRLDIRQTGADIKSFAPGAKLLRVDIDPDEMTNHIKPDERQYVIDIRLLIPELCREWGDGLSDGDSWLAVCDEIRQELQTADLEEGNRVVSALGGMIPKEAVITTDVGQNQVWVAQSFQALGRRVLFSGGHGAMGYSLPAAIGACLAGERQAVAFTGDGGLQMNIQEFQFLVRENLPVKIVLLNNHSLGMIRHFQEMYFDESYVMTQKAKGYDTPDFCALARAYGIQAFSVDAANISSVEAAFAVEGPALIEVRLSEDTYVYPKLAMGKPTYDQEPKMDSALQQYLLKL